MTERDIRGRAFARAAAATRICAECGRVFDLTDETDANEFYYGHDCEV